jgi:hypothetical protein
MALGSTSGSDRNVYQEYVLGPMRRADNLTTFMYCTSRNSRSLNLLEPYGPVQAFIGIRINLPYMRFPSSVASVNRKDHFVV